MKTRIVIDIDKEDYDLETRAILGAVKNQIAIDSLYDDVFRPVLRYSENNKQHEYYEEVYGKLKEHFNL